MLTYVLFAIGFVFLIKGADFLVDGAVSVARRLNVSDLVIGLTVVALGTSTPELFVNIIASFKGNSDIANVFLILGISSVIYPLAVTKGTVWKEIPFSLLAAIVLLFMANDQILDGAGGSVLTRIDGLIFLCFFTIFIYYTFSITARVEGMEQHVPAKHIGWLRSSLCIIAGLVGLAIGGKWIVAGAIVLATKLGMSEALIGLTIVAVGTSLPELATSAVAAYKKMWKLPWAMLWGQIFSTSFSCSESAPPLSRCCFKRKIMSISER